MIGVDHSIPNPNSKVGKVGFQDRTDNYYKNYVGSNLPPLGNKIPGFKYLKVGRYTDEKGTEVDYTANCIKLVESPSSNCQMTVLGAAYSILNAGFSRKEMAEMFEDLKSNYLGTRSLMVDIKSNHVPKLKQIIEDNGYVILFETSYINTTGSGMTAVYMDLYPGQDDDDDDDDWDDDDDD